VNCSHRCLLSAALLVESCALTNRGTSLTPHYFDVAVPPKTSSETVPIASPTMAQSEDAHGAAPCALQLGAIGADDGIGESIVYRTSAQQVARYETRRWSASPEQYLERALVRRLFDEGRCRRVLSGVAMTLDARLIAFEEQRGMPNCAHVAVHIIVSDGQTALHEETVDRVGSCRPATSEEQSFEEFVRAISQALDDIVARITEVVSVTAATASHPKAKDEDGEPIH
jgi:uncharacterized lipoprotein YmbA